MEAMLGQSRRGVNPRSGQVTVQTQPPLAEQETNTTLATHPNVFLEKAEGVHSFSAKLGYYDREITYITGLDIDNEHMFVVDNKNNRTKVFTHEGQFKFVIKVNYPYDVAVSQTGHLYITSEGDSCVQVYSTRGQQVTTMGQGLLEFPQGITLNRQGHVMVYDTGKKSILTFHADSGQLLNTIPISMCGYPVYITVNSVNDNIVISDWGSDTWGPCVHVLSPTGDHLYQYDGSREGSELRLPQGVCTDSYGHIFIADWDNHSIVALSPQGQFIRYIVTEDDGLKFPQAVVINPATGQLVVGEYDGNVKTFKYFQLKQAKAMKMVEQGQNQQNEPTPQPKFSNQCCVNDTSDEVEVAPPMDLYNLGSYSGGAESVRSAPQRSSHPLPGVELQRHGGNHFQLRPNQQYYQQDPYQQNQLRIQSNIGSQLLQQGNFQSQTLPGESTGPNQRQEGQESRLPQEPVTDHHLEEQGGVHFQTSRQSGHDFPPLSPQQDPVAAGDQDQGDPQTIRRTGNTVLNQAYGDNQLERLPTAVPHEIAGVLRHITANAGNMHITFNVYHDYSGKESVTLTKEKDVTASFHKHIPPSVKKQLNETLSQDGVWDQVKKMYGISDETPRPPDIVASLLSEVEGSIASFISVLLKLKECHREGQQDIPQDLIDEVKEGLLSEMEYKKLREKVIDFAAELSIYMGKILDYLYQFNVIPDEEITKLKNDAKRNPQDACRDLFKALLAISPKKEPIKHLKAAFRDSGIWYLADELEVSYQDVEDELQKLGGDGLSCEEPLSIGMAAPPTPATGENPIGPH
ncbi:uncharacterized protein LOC106159462 isoform X2 [Lingula anatina]|uniref:Uncharacterized protein LOC106159462 isoform X2 n=1 Tax=Lingula anatina TaxID=7574 RepID=A0A1S3I1H9_LINAN|nr:uncharacterized protein LOC106159462 isoform X2 [Lingula anatina]|eukprot:XP_013391204.1 uncharacterized protein LOC106159462 isoform X2 [Lingula anatina]